MNKNIYHNITLKVKQERKLFAVLIDPDKQNFADLLKTIQASNKAKIDFFLVGGSIITDGNIDNTVHAIKENSTIPVVLFPGNHNHISIFTNTLFMFLTTHPYLLFFFFHSQ